MGLMVVPANLMNRLGRLSFLPTLSMRYCKVNSFDDLWQRIKGMCFDASTTEKRSQAAVGGNSSDKSEALVSSFLLVAATE